MTQHVKSPVKERQQRLNRVLSDYLRAIEAGEMPDREALLKRYPDLADVLAEFFANWQKLEDWFGPLGAVAQSEQIMAFHEWEGAENRAAESASAPADTPSLDNYQLLKEIARGGRGPVYRALDVRTSRLVAIKFLLAGKLASAVEAERFRSALEGWRRLDHPHIVPVYEVGERNGQRFLVMKLVPGGSLDRQLSRFTSDPRAAAELAATLARALDYAHQAGVVHADLRPANVLMGTDGQPSLYGFGLSELSLADQGLPPLGAIGRRLCYVSPEQLVGNDYQSPVSDVYGLGALLYELLTGQPPFQAEQPIAILAKIVSSDPQPPHELQPQVPRALEEICLRCLQKERSRRPASAAAVADELDAFLAGKPVRATQTIAAAAPASALGATTPRRRRLWQPLFAAAAGVALAIALGYHIENYLLRDLRTQRDEALHREQLVRSEQASWQAERESLFGDLQRAQAQTRELSAGLERSRQAEQAARMELDQARGERQALLDKAERQKAEAVRLALRDQEDAIRRLTREKEEADHRVMDAEAARKAMEAQLAQAQGAEKTPPALAATERPAATPSVAKATERTEPIQPTQYAAPEPSRASLPAMGPSNQAAKRPADPDSAPASPKPSRSDELDRATVNALRNGSALLTVLMHPNAEMTVQGERIHRAGQRGERRVFLTPPLEDDGDTQFYEIGVTWMTAEGLQTRTATVAVESGHRYVVDLRPES